MLARTNSWQSEYPSNRLLRPCKTASTRRAATFNCGRNCLSFVSTEVNVVVVLLLVFAIRNIAMLLCAKLH